MINISNQEKHGFYISIFVISIKRSIVFYHDMNNPSFQTFYSFSPIANSVTREYFNLEFALLLYEFCKLLALQITHIPRWSYILAKRRIIVGVSCCP